MPQLPPYEIIEGSVEWADRYRQFCQEAYRASYPRPDLGLTEDLFSKEIFDSPRIRKFFVDRCTRTADQRSWLAIYNDEILGVVSAHRYSDHCDMQSFYVKAQYKGHGLGHALCQKVLDFADGLQLQVDVVTYMTETIDMYKHWGFEVDGSRDAFSYNVEEWPEAANQAYKAIYMIKPAAKD